VSKMERKLVVSILSGALGIALLAPAAAQSPDEVKALSKEVEALKAGQASMQKDLQEIKNLLQGAQVVAPAQAAAPAAAQAPARVPTAEQTDVMISVANAPSKGASSAKVTLVEFTDYQCPYCSRHYRQTWPQIEAEYVNTGKVKLVLRDMPLEQIHPQALKAAEAARCAAEQGKYWEMHDRLFANQNALSRKDLSTHAQAIALDVGKFDKCVDSSVGKDKVRQDATDSARAGARGTPTFYLGLTAPDSTEIRAVRLIRGAVPYATFKEAIDGLLASAN